MRCDKTTLTLSLRVRVSAGTKYFPPEGGQQQQALTSLVGVRLVLHCLGLPHTYDVLGV